MSACVHLGGCRRPASALIPWDEAVGLSRTKRPRPAFLGATRGGRARRRRPRSAAAAVPAAVPAWAERLHKRSWQVAAAATPVAPPPVALPPRYQLGLRAHAPRVEKASLHVRWGRVRTPQPSQGVQAHMSQCATDSTVLCVAVDVPRWQRCSRGGARAVQRLRNLARSKMLGGALPPTTESECTLLPPITTGSPPPPSPPLHLPNPPGPRWVRRRFTRVAVMLLPQHRRCGCPPARRPRPRTPRACWHSRSRSGACAAPLNQQY